MRIGGLASGMDIDQLVSDLMKAERIPLDKLYQKKQILEWQRDDYRSMNTLLQDLDSYIFNNLTLQSNMLKKKTTSSDESVVTATANASAANISTNLTVTKVATSATWVSEASASYTPSGTDTTLKINVTNGDGTSPTNPVTITIAANSSLDSVIAQLNSNNDLGISVFHDTQTGKISIMKKDTGAAASLVMGDATTASFFQSLGFTGAADGGELTGKTAGEDARFTINGLTTSRSSNTFTINGVTYTLKKPGSSTSPLHIPY